LKFEGVLRYTRMSKLQIGGTIAVFAAVAGLIGAKLRD
jgi:hypothetical protein